MHNAIKPFELERYFARYEFSAKYLISASDCESLGLTEIIYMADPETKRLWDSLSLGYTESLGLPLLREEISTLYQSISPDKVLEIVPEEGIFISMMTLLEPGDEVIVLMPAYQSLHEIARGAGCKVISWPMLLQEGRWTLDWECLKTSLSDKTKLIIINFPHNPTGFIPEENEWQQLINLADSCGAYIFCDEMYRYLEYSPVKQLPSIADSYKKGIGLSGMSKAFALPGLRVGWLVTQDQSLYRKWMNYKDYTTICASAPSEVLALIGLKNRDRILERNLSIISKNLKKMAEFLKRQPGVLEWIMPLAGSVAFPRLISSEPVNEFCNRLVSEKSVMAAPGNLFGYKGQHIRFGLGRQNFGEALDLFEDFIGE